MCPACTMAGSFFFFFNDTATTEIYTLSPTRRSSDLFNSDSAHLTASSAGMPCTALAYMSVMMYFESTSWALALGGPARSEEHTSELQSRLHLVCRLLLEKKKSSRHPSSASPTPCWCA